MPEPRPTRVALLTPGDTLPAWAAAEVQRLVEESDAEIALVVEDTSSRGRGMLETLSRLIELREWGVVAAVRELFGDDPEQLERVPVRNIDGVADAEHVGCEPESVQGWKNAIPDPVVEHIATTDVAVRFGFGFLVGDALTAPTYGVLSYHHGDFREYRGQPAGFWEYVHDRETAGVTLQRINETLDGGEIVVSETVEVGDVTTWDAMRARLFDASTGMLATGVRRLAEESFEPETLDPEELGDIYTLPRGRPVATYLRKRARATLR